jgi:hypothetical protein
MQPKYNPVDIARQFLFIREAQSIGQNMGQRVNAIQTWTLGQAGLGTSWCAEFVWMVLDIAYGGNCPLPRTGSTQVMLDFSRQGGKITDTPSEGDLYFYINAAGRAHHVGIVTALNPLTGIAGNTSADGSSPNGDRVAEHAIDAHVFVHYLPAA